MDNNRQKYLKMSLYENKSKKINIRIDAEFVNDALTFSGHETGDDVDEFWGDDDYEYWYKLDPENTQKLLGIIGGTEDPMGAITREFCGIEACRHLREICDVNGINYRFESYV